MGGDLGVVPGGHREAPKRRPPSGSRIVQSKKQEGILRARRGPAGGLRGAVGGSEQFTFNAEGALAIPGDALIAA